MILTNLCIWYNALNIVLIKILVSKQRFIRKSNGLMSTSCQTQVLLVTVWLSQSLVVVRDVLSFSPRYFTKNTPEDKIFVFLIKILVRKRRFIQKSNGLMSTSCQAQVLLVMGWLSQSLVAVRDVLSFSPRYFTKNTPEDKIFVFSMNRNMFILGRSLVGETKKA